MGRKRKKWISDNLTEENVENFYRTFGRLSHADYGMSERSGELGLNLEIHPADGGAISYFTKNSADIYGLLSETESRFVGELEGLIVELYVDKENGPGSLKGISVNRYLLGIK